MRALAIFIGFAISAAAAQADVALHATYLKLEQPPAPVLSNLDSVPEDDGIAGARLGLMDNATTGRFLGQTFTLDVVSLPAGSDPLPSAEAALAAAPFLIVDARAEEVTAIADLQAAKNALIFSVSAADEGLRSADCRANLFHTGLSYSMRSDALMQTLLAKRWTTVALVTGSHPEDRLWAEALKGSVRKFGLNLVGELDWDERADLRRTASSEVPILTQDLPDHDIFLVADETDDFARYIAMNTWLPRPVAGSEGLMPVGWSTVVEQWGAAQLQGRFEEAANRAMRPRDYAAWAALRTLGEAVTRTGSTDSAILRAYILSDEFELAAFKGRPLSYRRWNGQLRQPVPVVTSRALVAEAPLEGFLHERNELDTLGLDRAESACTAFGDSE